MIQINTLITFERRFIDRNIHSVNFKYQSADKQDEYQNLTATEVYYVPLPAMCDIPAKPPAWHLNILPLRQ
jgi:hypothetical protein